jgi:hypothetical protein
MSKNLSSILRGANYGLLPISSGGTNSTTASGALTALGAQSALVSGTTIKTIGGVSLLGTGNIDVASTGKSIAMSIVFGG